MADPTLPPDDASQTASPEPAKIRGSTNHFENALESTGGKSPATANSTPERIGEYRILGVLGRGGMGLVYRAQQLNPRREVALKVIGLSFVSPDLLRRFDLEVQTLGRLKHPGIAQVYEAGLVPTDHGKQPFFAMELIENGTQLDRFADEQKLDLKSRLVLFSRVCDAVQYAHQQGVIHRDLKPDNILVTADGQPKILDFGVARATDSDVNSTTLHTDVGQIIGTLPYMSPEQAGGNPDEIDTRSDVYALGVILYLLLGKRMPYELAKRAFVDAVRVIREEEPSRLSSINRSYRGDVETIVSKALAKEKDRRYASANDLASDIRRYLKDEPITARPPGTWYQLSKFAKRNKAVVAGALSTFLMLIVGVVVSTLYAIEATRQRADAMAQRTEAMTQRTEAMTQKADAMTQRDEARKALTRAETVTELIRSALVSSDPNQEGKQGMLVADAMQQAIASLDAGDLKEQPEVEGSLRITLSQILNGNARSEQALAQAEKSLAIDQRIFPIDELKVAASQNAIGLSLTSLGRSAEAMTRFETSLTIYHRLLEGDQPEIANALNNIGSCLQSLGRIEEALPKLQASLDVRRRLFKGDDANVANSLNSVAHCLTLLGRNDEALPMYEASLAMRSRLYPGDHPDVATSLINVADCLKSLGRGDEALPKFEAALAMLQQSFKGDHPYVANALNNVASGLEALGKSADALPRYEAALAMQQRLNKGDHPAVALSLNNVASCLQSLRRSEESLPRYEAALSMYQRLFSGDHPDTAGALNNVASCLSSLNRSEDALPKYEAAMAMRKRIFTGDHPSLAISTNGVAFCLNLLGRSEEALPKYVEALEMRQRIYNGDHPEIAGSLTNVAQCLTLLNQSGEALPKYEAALAMYQRLFKRDHPSVATIINNLASCLATLGRYGEAEAYERELLAWRESHLEVGNWQIDSGRGRLGRALYLQGRFDEAQSLVLTAAEALPANARVPARRRREALATAVEFYEKRKDASNTDVWQAKLDQFDRDFPAAKPVAPATAPSK